MKEEKPSKKKYWLRFLISLSVLYLFFLILNIAGEEYTEWITSNWSLSSKDNLLLFTFFQTLSILIIVLAAVFGLHLAYRMMKSRHRRKWFALFFLILGLFGFFAYFQFVPGEEKIEFIHIPIIASLALVMSLGALFFRKKKQERTYNQ
jgi:uncharacterized membrane protein YhaH (DUF805 family)